MTEAETKMFLVIPHDPDVCGFLLEIYQCGIATDIKTSYTRKCLQHTSK